MKKLEILAVLGAGASQPSGIPTFRGHGSSGTPEDNPFFHYGWWKDDYDGGIRFFEKMREDFDVGENGITEFLKLLDSEHSVSFVSQNIDKLDSGMSDVLKMHGSLYGNRCSNNPRHSVDVLGSRCVSCGAKTIPDVIHYGEPYPKATVEALSRLANRNWDIILLVGTSLQISSVESFVKKASKKSELKFEFNKSEVAEGFELFGDLDSLRDAIRDVSLSIGR